MMRHYSSKTGGNAQGGGGGGGNWQRQDFHKSEAAAHPQEVGVTGVKPAKARGIERGPIAMILVERCVVR